MKNDTIIWKFGSIKRVDHLVTVESQCEIIEIIRRLMHQRFTDKLARITTDLKMILQLLILSYNW